MPKTPLRKEVVTILLAMLTLGIPTALTLSILPVPPSEAHQNPLRFGYTCSLLIFLVPVLVIGRSHLWLVDDPILRRSMRFAASLIAGLGVFLDLAFGHAFFEFPNARATLGIRAPAWSWSTLSFVPDYLPVEEFGFYILGGLFLVMVYLWIDQRWLSAYSAATRTDPANMREPLINPSFAWMFSWFGILAAGILFKFLWNSADQNTDPWYFRLPWYFIFIMSLGFLPSILFFRTLHNFVNWPAFATSYLVLFLISVIWEVTLGLPYQWWTYRAREMVGVAIPAWSSLPLEAVLVWLIIAWMSVGAFELFRVSLHQRDRTVWQRLFGDRAGRVRAGEARKPNRPDVSPVG